IWCPTPGPVADPTPVEVRHGFGYTRFTKHRSGIAHETTVFVPREAPLKITHVRLRNEGDAPRRLSAAAYAQWVAGSTRRDRRFIVTEYHRETGSILARNPRNEYLGEAWAFATFIVPGVAEGRHTTVGPEFLGPLGDPAHPAALLEGDREGELNGRTGAVADPCAAFLRSFEMAPGGTAEVIFVIGQVEDVYDLSRRLDDFRTPDGVDAALEDVRAFWRDITSVFRVESPSPAIDLMLNGWLVYQNLSCRLWGRSALYQSGGAFGFRDQLQDAASLAAIRPQITREQILLHAAHQFEDGDVLHWWHPVTRRGIRTKFSDDLLWLPYVTLHYVETTGDAGLWDEKAPYVRGPVVPAGDDEILFDAAPTEREDTVFEHCCRALDRSLATGEHGLPLMGSGDWNDGMNRVGRSGKGESVWLAFFLLDILRRFAAVCESRGDAERASAYRRHAERLRESVNDAGWDGSWYRRAYYDNGDPLGSSENDEAKIDALAQAWAVLSGAAPEARARQALDALEEHL